MSVLTGHEPLTSGEDEENPPEDVHPAEAERDCAAKLREEMVVAVGAKLTAIGSNAESFFPVGAAQFAPGGKAAGVAAMATRLAAEATRAFFDQDLLAAARQLLAGAKGSFGLLLSHSLDAGAEGEVVMAARGQTMSAAVYPHLNIVLWGSEASATKAGMTMPMKHPTTKGWNEAGPVCCPDAFRFDLDAVNGEVLLLRWGADVPEEDKTQKPWAPPLKPGSLGRGATSNDLYTWSTRGASAKQRAKAKGAAPKRGGVGCVNSGLESEYQFTKAVGSDNRLSTYSPAQAAPKGTVCLLSGGQLLSGFEIMRYGEGRLRLVGYNKVEGQQRKPFWPRVVRLHNNPLIMPLSPRVKDPVGQDLVDLPGVLERIVDDWDDPSDSLNRITAWTFVNKLKARLRMYAAGEHDGSVDLLITGCEVSLWMGEQFAADLHTAFPQLSVLTLSANKVLGLLGQTFPVPQAGFQFTAQSFNLRKSIVLIITHSGGTFASLNCANLLAAFTTDIFAVTSEWDTQVAAAVRAHNMPGRGSWNFASFVFTTFAGSRPAEPCSLSVAATHQLLTQLLLYVMYYFPYFMPKEGGLGGSRYFREEVQELSDLNRSHLKSVREIVGQPPVPGVVKSSKDTAIGSSLRAQGRRWAQHVLEAPWSWIASFCYIVVTVTAGATPLSAIVGAIHAAASSDAEVPAGANATTCEGAAEAELPGWLNHLRGFVDAIIYAFLPWWTTVLIRLVQGRPWLHRVAGRSVLIGDIPWVSQAVEAYASKLFALTYSITGVSFASANPADHLVHRHTHRVVRGALLAVGRPDGRLNALTSAESTVCLSVNQASSIQNFGVTCESITIGHNPFKLPLSQANLVLPTLRPKFLCEAELEAMAAKQSGAQPALKKAVTKVATVETLNGGSPPKRRLSLKDAVKVVAAEEAAKAEKDAAKKLKEAALAEAEAEAAAAAAAEARPDRSPMFLRKLGSKNKLSRSAGQIGGEENARDGSPPSGKVKSFRSAAVLAKSKSSGGMQPAKSVGAMMGMMADILNEDSLALQVEEGEHTNERPPMFDKIPSLEQPFLGAWMARHPRFRGKNTGALMHAQLDVQVPALIRTRGERPSPQPAIGPRPHAFARTRAVAVRDALRLAAALRRLCGSLPRHGTGGAGLLDRRLPRPARLRHVTHAVHHAHRHHCLARLRIGRAGADGRTRARLDATKRSQDHAAQCEILASIYQDQEGDQQQPRKLRVSLQVSLSAFVPKRSRGGGAGAGAFLGGDWAAPAAPAKAQVERHAGRLRIPLGERGHPRSR